MQPWLKAGMDATFILVDASCSVEFIARMKPVKASYSKGKNIFELIQ